MRHRGNGALGESDIEGKAARVAARMEPRGRDRHRWANPRGRSGREHMSQSGDASESMLSQFRRDPISVSRRRELLMRRMRSILTKSMKDSVVRGCLLWLLYKCSRERSIRF